MEEEEIETEKKDPKDEEKLEKLDLDEVTKNLSHFPNPILRVKTKVDLLRSIIKDLRSCPTLEGYIEHASLFLLNLIGCK